jgi:hypothetical protein
MGVSIYDTILQLSFGKDSITVGSQMENFGNNALPPKPIFPA